MKRQSDIYRERIKGLRVEYNQIMSSLTKIKDKKLWDAKHSEALSIQQEIHVLRTKANNLDSGKPENGFSDWHEGYRILE